MTKKEPKIKIFVSHHKPWYIYEDDIFVPIQVWKKNAKVDLWILWDDTWDNISEKNSQYAELTAQYWVWKNYDLSDVDYVWFCHYRRYPTYCYKTSWRNISKSIKWIWNRVLLYKEHNYVSNFSDEILKKVSESIKQFIKNRDYHIYMPKKDIFIDPGSKIFDYYVNIHDIDMYKTSISTFLDIYPNYKKDLMCSKLSLRYNHRNMFIMDKYLFLEYSKRLFDYLFLLERNRIKNKISPKWRITERWAAIHAEVLINIFINHLKILWKYNISYDSNILFIKEFKK